MSQDNENEPGNEPGRGIGGTDGGGQGPEPGNVAALFPDQPSAAPLPAQADVIRLLEILYAQAQEGKITGLVVIGFDEMSNGSHAVVGKCPYGTTLGAVADVQFQLMMQNLGNQVRRK